MPDLNQHDGRDNYHNEKYDYNYHYLTEGDSQKPKKIESAREPIFNNISMGTVILLVIMIAVQAIRGFAPKGYDFNWALASVFDTNIMHNTPETMGLNLFQRYWSLIGYQFMHGGWIHLTMNAFMLLQVGPFTEISFIKGADIGNYRYIKNLPEVARAKINAAIIFVLYFLLCGILSALGYYVLNLNTQGYLVGASGSISGIFGGYLLAAFKMAPKGQVQHLLKPILSSGGMFLLINVVGAYFLRAAGLVPIAWEAHLAGFIAGIVLYPVFSKIALKVSPY